MDNQPTFTTVVVNKTTTPVSLAEKVSPSVVSVVNKAGVTTTLTETILQFPVYWDDLEATWDETGITWNQGTDITALTNVTI